MKNFLLLSTIIFALFSTTNAQQQWKFHVAFEDASMARDTIWFIWDTTATLSGIDTLLGECNTFMNYNEFNVYTIIGDHFPGDTTKIVAHPYNEYFGHAINAINFELPIKITWDSSMFHAPWLPPLPVGWVNYARIENDYFFNINNMMIGNQFDMTIADSIIAPEPNNPDPWFWIPEVHFPMDIFLSQDPSVDVLYAQANGSFRLNAFPNPFSNSIKFSIESPNSTDLVKIRVIDLFGRLFYETESFRVDGCFQESYIQELENKLCVAPSGFYVATLESNQSIVNSIKIVKLKK